MVDKYMAMTGQKLQKYDSKRNPTSVTSCRAPIDIANKFGSPSLAKTRQFPNLPGLVPLCGVIFPWLELQSTYARQLEGQCCIQNPNYSLSNLHVLSAVSDSEEDLDV